MPGFFKGDRCQRKALRKGGLKGRSSCQPIQEGQETTCSISIDDKLHQAETLLVREKHRAVFPVKPPGERVKRDDAPRQDGFIQNGTSSRKHDLGESSADPLGDALVKPAGKAPAGYPVMKEKVAQLVLEQGVKAVGMGNRARPVDENSLPTGNRKGYYHAAPGHLLKLDTVGDQNNRRREIDFKAQMVLQFPANRREQPEDFFGPGAQ